MGIIKFIQIVREPVLKYYLTCVRLTFVLDNVLMLFMFVVDWLPAVICPNLTLLAWVCAERRRVSL